ncbi:MAG: ParB N-terminal domain-containing protein [Caldilineaceae bacterium]
MSVPKIVMLGVNEIIAAPFNPEERTEIEALAVLEGQIKELGGIVVPLIVSKDMRLIDGHRRLACAKRLKMKEVPAIVTSLGLQAGWAGLNTSAMPITSRQFIKANSMGLDDAYLSRSQRRKIQRLRTLAGDHYEEIARDGISTNVLSIVNRIGGATNDKSDAWLSRVLLWVIRHHMQTPARKAIEAGVSPAVLCDAIRQDYPLVQSWGMKKGEGA